MSENVLSQGISYYKSKKYTDALTFFLSLPSDSGADSNDLAYYLGLCYTKLSHYEDALLYLEQVVTSASSDTKDERVLQCRFILALIYAVSGRKRLANFELGKLAELGYKPASVYAALAFVAWEQREVEKSQEFYEKALSLDPDNVTALNGIGYILACQEKDLGKALSYCKRAVDYAPESAACLDSLGFVYYKMGLYKDAKHYLEMAEQIDGQNPLIMEHMKGVMLDGDR